MKLTDTISLQPLVTGGQACETDGFCGEGKCIAAQCVCNHGWMGPRCLVRSNMIPPSETDDLKVPAHTNDFPDWDVDHWEAPKGPFVPYVLRFGAVILSLAMIMLMSAILKTRSKRYQSVI